MKPATLAVLGVLGAAALGAGLLLGRDPTGAGTQDAGASAGPAAGQLAFPALAPRLQSAARVEVVRGDRTLVVTKSGADQQQQRWVLPDKGGYPVQVDKLRGVLTGLTELRLVEARTSDPAQWGRLGLDDPRSTSGTAILLRVLDAGGAVIAEAVLGHRRVRMGGNVPEQIFVRLPGQQQTWLAEGRLAADADPQLWLDRDIADIPNARVAEARVMRGGDVPPLEVARAEGAGSKPTLRLPAEHGPVEEYRVEDVFRAFETLTLTDVQPVGAAMPGESVGTSAFTTTDGLRVEVAGNRAGDQFWVRLAASGPGSEPLQARWSGWAYQLGQWKEKQLLPRLEDLLATPPASAAPAAAPAASDAPASPDAAAPAPPAAQ